MTTASNCPKCGTPVADSEAGGACPKCLLGLGLQMGDPTVARPSQPGFQVPRVEELVDRFPNLEIQHFVGQGGMGAVYQARQIGLDRQVALKILSPRLSDDPSFAERFTREARTLAKLTHPNIVMVFEYGQAAGMNYLVMEFVDGVNLRDAIIEGKLSPEEALAIVPQICDALQYAHDEGVIHRDIKPENILIDKRGRVKIADFGLAKLLEPDVDEFTLTGTQQILGTRNYMAPEQIEKPEIVDHRADIYSLGVVFYELLTGELPIGRFSMPSEKAPVNQQLDDVVLRTLEKEPDRRFQQASEIRTAVDSIAKDYAAAHPVENTQTAAADVPPPVSSFQPDYSGRGTPNCSVPFSIGELYGGLATAYGIAHVLDASIELEYEVRDEVFGSVKSGAKRVEIPIRNILSITFVKGIFSDRVEVQTDRLDIAQDVPNSKQARFQMAIKRADAEKAMQFVEQVENQRAKGAPAGASPVPPRKKEPFVEVHTFPNASSFQVTLPLDDVDKSLNAPHIGFLVAAWIDLVVSVSAFAKSAVWKPLNKVLERDWIPGDIILLIPKFSIGTMITFAVALWLFTLASKIKQRKDPQLIFISCIILLFAPSHSAYVVTAIFCIWMIILLCDQRIRDAFSTDARFVAKAEVGVGPTTRHHAEGMLRTVLLLGFLAFCMVLTSGILYLAMSYKATKRVENAPAAPAAVVAPEQPGAVESNGSVITVEAGEAESTISASSSSGSAAVVSESAEDASSVKTSKKQ